MLDRPAPARTGPAQRRLIGLRQHDQQVAASTCCAEPMATRATVPAFGAVIDASIFIASIVARCPDRDRGALSHLQRHHARERRVHMPWVASVRSATGRSEPTDRSRTWTARN